MKIKTMRTLSSLLFVIATITFLSACSKCYECQTERLYNNVVDTVIEDICTATGEEIDDREAEGATCTPTSGF